MNVRTEPASQPSLSSLISGILKDAKELVVQGAALAKLEVKDELRKAKSAAIAASIGLGVAAVGGVLLILMIVHLLASFTDLPLWGSYGAVGAVLVVTGLVLFGVGKSKVD
ncbi:MAG: phage holin family protein [Candidatus Binatia bacterium]